MSCRISFQGLGLIVLPLHKLYFVDMVLIILRVHLLPKLALLSEFSKVWTPNHLKECCWKSNKISFFSFITSIACFSLICGVIPRISWACFIFNGVVGAFFAFSTTFLVKWITCSRPPEFQYRIPIVTARFTIHLTRLGGILFREGRNVNAMWKFFLLSSHHLYFQLFFIIFSHNQSPWFGLRKIFCSYFATKI